MPYAELEIGLHRVETGPGIYQTEIRFSDPGNEAEVPPERGPAVLDLQGLLELRPDPEAYGRKLAEDLFQAENVRRLYDRARAATEAQGSFLRIRLSIGPSALELHALRWELLTDPESGSFLATSERTPFSRFMVSSDWRPVHLRAKAGLRALVAVAAPSDVESYRLAPVDVEAEVRRARENLGDVHVTVAGQDEPLTLNRLLTCLRGTGGQPGVDVLYLVCHGMLSRQHVPFLFLQDEDGKVARVEGEKLARGVAELQHPPRLAFLASCQSARTEATTTEDGRSAAESAPAPRLAEAGIPAVVAMQGKISMETVEQAIPVFFRELTQDGQIDRAMAVARAAVRDRHDAWMPALYLRLRQGKIWYVPGFGEEDFSKWSVIASNVRGGTFIPILGPELAEHVFGSSRENARRLSESHHFPLAAHDRSDMAKVAQYLSVDQSPKYARDRIVRQLHRQLLDRSPELAALGKQPFPKLVDARVERFADDDPFRILAGLPASIYVTTSGDPLLLKTLKAAGREPTPLLCDWRPTPENTPQEPSYKGRPTRESPIVYHVFGVLGKPASLVLTEDDFFDYLIATSEYKLLPTVVRGSLTRNSLLFLGFRLDDWTFRVLFRLIVTLNGSRHLRSYAHVGVQVDPEENDLVDVERARKYLEQYYETGSDTPPISIYWGTAADFLKELKEQMKNVSTDDDIPSMIEEDDDDWLC